MLLHHHLSVIAHSALDMQSMATSNHPAIFLVQLNLQDGGSHQMGMMQVLTLLQSWTGLNLPCCPHLTPRKAPPHALPLPPPTSVPPPPPNFGLTAPHFLSPFHPFVLKGPQPSRLFDPSLANSFALMVCHAAFQCTCAEIMLQT